MKVGCYIRVSTQEQAKEGYSIGAQTERLRAYCLARGWTVYEIYTDPAYSGAKLARPALQKLISDVQNSKIDLVLVYKLDRLSRSQKDTLYLIEDVFMKNGAAFISLNENFDTSTAFGRAMMGILSVFAQLEREQIKERSQMGRIERAKDGLWKGGGYVPIGYDYNQKTDQLTINEYEAVQVREVFDMFVNKHYAITKIAKDMSNRGYNRAWEFTSTAKNVLSNQIYAGKIVWQGEVYEGKHEPIISTEMFCAAQKRLSGISSKEYSPFTATQLLSGIIYCKNCGGRYYGSGAYRGSKKLPNSQREYIHIYACYSRTKTQKSMVKDPNCKNKNWRAEILDQYVIDEIFKLSTNPDYFDEIVCKSKKPDDSRQKRDAFLNRLSELDIQISKLIDLYQFGDIPADKVAERLETLASERASLERFLAEMADESPELTAEQARSIISDAARVFESGSIDDRRQLVQFLIRRIDIFESDIFISWRFV